MCKIEIYYVQNRNLLCARSEIYYDATIEICYVQDRNLLYVKDRNGYVLRYKFVMCKIEINYVQHRNLLCAR